MNASLQSNDWKKTLQTFLKGQGKSLMNDFNHKAILVSLHGGGAFVVNSSQIDSIMAQKRIKPVLQQHLQFKPTQNNTMKAYYKEASGRGAEPVNLVIYNQEEGVDQRSNLFAINELHELFNNKPDHVRRATLDFYNHVSENGSEADRVCAKISKILTDAGYPYAYLVLFKDKADMLKMLHEKCNQSHHSSSNPSKRNSDLIKLLDRLNTALPQDYCRIFRDHDFDHCKINNLSQLIKGAENPGTSDEQKKHLSDFVMACLKLDINCPTPYISQGCGSHCTNQCSKIKDFIANYFE